MIDVSFPAGAHPMVTDLLEDWKTLDWTVVETEGGGFEARAVLPDTDSQPLVDALQARLAGFDNWRVIIVPLEAAIGPKTEGKVPADTQLKGGVIALREEIYQDVASGAEIDSNFLILTVLSAIVAAIGMAADSVAVVIGAMVIAPLLGPLLAFSFASALGDLELMAKGAKTALMGLAVGFATAFVIGALIDVDLASGELSDRTVLGLDSVSLALASGGAAALSITRGLSSTLVGVMVAVALLPPSVAVAVYLGAGEFALSARAGVLLATNVISVNIASLLVFALKGIRPRTWLERKSASRSRQINLAVWGALLLGVMALIVIVLN